jgi:hypothetical protein
MRSVHRSSARGLGREVGDDAEVVTGPHAIYRLVEDTLAGSDVEGGTVVAAPYHHVVEPASQLQRPVVATVHQRIVRRERVAGVSGMNALPGVPLADALVTQGLQAAPETHAGRVGGGVEVSGQDHVVCLPLV